MIIAVSMRTVMNETYPETRDAISHDWIRALETFSITPVLVPNTLANPSAFLRAVGARGLLLTGGENVSTVLGEASNAAATPSERDRTETLLLDGALANRLPVFGVCRGLQMVNAYFGGGIVRDLSALGAHVNTQHPVEITAPVGALDAGKRAITNSYHAQGVLVKGLAAELRAFAQADGSVVEGLYHPNYPLVAVQWHPERANPAADLDRALLQDWLRRCE